MKPHLIGILGFNSQERLDRCLASVLTTMPPDECDVVVVDNSTEPLKIAADARVYSWPVRHITGGGFTAALRWFLEMAAADGRLTATFLNDDLLVEPSCLGLMLSAAEEPRVGVACPMQVAMHSPQVIVCGGTGKAYPGGVHKTGTRGLHWRERCDARWMPFAAVTFSMQALRDVGLPDDNMALWFSDSDYCIRCRLAGYRVVYLGEQAVVRHEVSASCNAMDPVDRRTRFVSDMLAFKRKWGGGILKEYST
jgi:GT2 family glycosyltransferase